LKDEGTGFREREQEQGQRQFPASCILYPASFLKLLDLALNLDIICGTQ